MPKPITANYSPDGDDWAISVTLDGETLTGRAPGLIAARDTADQLVEKLAPTEADAPANAPTATVVHLLDGDPVAFSVAYLNARHGRLPAAPVEHAPAASEWPSESEHDEHLDSVEAADVAEAVDEDAADGEADQVAKGAVAPALS